MIYILGLIFVVIWCCFLEIIASKGKALEKSYWEDKDDNWAKNIVEYLKEKDK